MAQLVIAAAGSAIGGAVLGTGVVALGLTGNAIGWTVGSLIGSMFSPTQKSQGPRLSDLTVTGSAYGTPIPYLVGGPRVAPQIIWASPKHEIATTTEQGKGGGGSEYTSYTYTVDLLLLLADNQMAVLGRVWSNGKLVYDPIGGSGADAAPWSRITFYDGNASQLPDPTYEADKGADALAYRGRTTVFIEGLQLGSGGQIPNLTFELFSHVSVSTPEMALVSTTTMWAASSGCAVRGNYCYVPQYSGASLQTFDVSDPTSPVSTDLVATLSSPQECVIVGDKMYVTYGSWRFRVYDLSTPAVPAVLGTLVSHGALLGMAVSGNYVYVGENQTHEIRAIDVSSPSSPTFVGSSGDVGNGAAEFHLGVRGDYLFAVGTGTGNSYLYVFDISTPTTPVLVDTILTDEYPYTLVITGIYMFVGFQNSTTFTVYDISDPLNVVDVAGGTGMGTGVHGMNIVGDYMYCVSNASDSLFMWDISGLPSDPVLLQTLACTGDPWNLTVAGDKLYVTDLSATKALQIFELTGATGPYSPTLQEVTRDVLLRAGMSEDQFDVSALADISQPVRAMAISQVSTARQVLDMLASAFFFEAVASDKLYFVPRGGAPVRTLAFDDLGWYSDGQTPPDPLALVDANELELPAQVALTYNAIESDYQTDTQYSDRLLSSMKSTNALTLPLGLTAAEAKQIADAMLVDSVVGLLSTKIALGLEHADLEPTDVVIATGADGSTYRLRLLKRSDAGGVSDFDVVLDDASVLTQAGVTEGGTASQTVVQSLAATTLALLDIPLLRDADDAPGYLLAVSGGGASNWRSAGVYDSTDAATYALQRTVDSQAVIGSATSVLANWTGGNVWDDVSTVTVQVDGELSSATSAAVIARRDVNAALIGDELVQYRAATLVSAGVYTLSGFLRGRRGTEWAMAGHLTSEQFVALGTSGMRFMRLQASELGGLRYVKAVTAGQLLSAVTAQTITPLGVSLKPLAPVLASADRSGSDTVLAWYRRSRLSSRITGPLAWSHPLGEASESYEIDVYADGAYASIVRTISASDTQVTYTAADQTTDFGSPPATLYLDIYQISATVGRGTALRAAV